MPVERSDTKDLKQTTLPFASSTAPSASPKKSKSKGKAKSGAIDRVHTDLILPINSKWIPHIAKREKNHEYRVYKVRPTTERFWLYETAPTGAITHVMKTTRPKEAGEVRDPTGIGNDDFDAGLKKSKYGYPILKLWKLKTPITTKDMRERFQLAVPQSFCYAPRTLTEAELLENMEELF